MSKSASDGFPEFTTGTKGSLSTPGRTIWSSVDADARKGRTSNERSCRRIADIQQRAGMKAAVRGEAEVEPRELRLVCPH